jgi:hypothetical protein
MMYSRGSLFPAWTIVVTWAAPNTELPPEAAPVGESSAGATKAQAEADGYAVRKGQLGVLS